MVYEFNVQRVYERLHAIVRDPRLQILLPMLRRFSEDDWKRVLGGFGEFGGKQIIRRR
jgi:hypothetical protein